MRFEYEVVILWLDGGKNVYAYYTEFEAQRVLKNMKMAFGNQIAWGGIRTA